MDILQVLEGLAYVGFIAGAIFAMIELREFRRDRKAELILRTIENRTSSDTQELAQKMDIDFRTAEEAEERVGRKALMTVGTYHEGLGYLIRNRLVDGQAVFETGDLAEVWDKMKPWTIKQRSIDPAGSAFFENFEYAADMDRAYWAKKKRKGV